MAGSRRSGEAVKLAAHLALFQLGWFSSVLGAAWELPLLGPLVVAALAVAHMRFMPVPGDVRRIIAAALLGLLVDSALAASGLVAYAGTPRVVVARAPLDRRNVEQLRASASALPPGVEVTDGTTYTVFAIGRSFNGSLRPLPVVDAP